jgi:tubulin polyglutamylase TTLL2
MAEENALIFRFNDNGQGPDIVQQVLLERGWVEFDEEIHKGHEWNFWWKGSRFRVSEYDQLLPWQRLNHYPKTTALTKKDSLSRNLKCMKGIYGASLYNFSPLCYNLPNDYKKFVADYTKKKQKDSDKLQVWICKPADLSRGRGIFIFRDLSELQYDCSAVLQKYITNPLLIAGYKFDIRVYVCVTSFHPLSIYIYQEGIVRFSTEKFDLNNLSNVYSHLTNTSINKFGPSYKTDKERVGPGCKWSITQLRHYFRQNEIDDRLLWCKVSSLVILTILAQANQVPKAVNCYELFGFDIIIDENLKPWLLEVNFSPALSIDCATDIITKKPMLHDLLDLLNFLPTDGERGGKNFIFSPANKPVDYFHTPYRTSHASVAKVKKVLVKVTKKPKTEKVVNISSKETLSETESSEEGPVELLVPGCGLPSVQMLKSRQSMSSSSGCSSAGSFDVNNIGAQSQTYLAKLPSYKSPAKNVRPRATPAKESHYENSAAFTNEKNKSRCKEISTASDSAVSGLSSENSDIGADNDSDKLAQVKLAQNKSNKLSKSVATMHSCYDKHVSIHAATASSKSFVNPYVTGKTFSRQYSLTRSTQNGESYNQRGRKLSEPGHQISRPPPLVRQNTQPTGFSPNRNGFKPKHALLPQRQKATNVLSPASSLSFSQKSFTNYARSDPFKTNPMFPTMQPRVGDYFLVFPFNEQMRGMGTNLDIRAVVREIQRMIKSKVNEVKGIGDVEMVCDLPQLWSPVRAPEEEAHQETSGTFGEYYFSYFRSFMSLNSFNPTLDNIAKISPKKPKSSYGWGRY